MRWPSRVGGHAAVRRLGTAPSTSRRRATSVSASGVNTSWITGPGRGGSRCGTGSPGRAGAGSTPAKASRSRNAVDVGATGGCVPGGRAVEDDLAAAAASTAAVGAMGAGHPQVGEEVDLTDAEGQQPRRRRHGCEVSDAVCALDQAHHLDGARHEPRSSSRRARVEATSRSDGAEHFARKMPSSAGCTAASRSRRTESALIRTHSWAAAAPLGAVTSPQPARRTCVACLGLRRDREQRPRGRARPRRRTRRRLGEELGPHRGHVQERAGQDGTAITTSPARAAVIAVAALHDQPDVVLVALLAVAEDRAARS